MKDKRRFLLALLSLCIVVGVIFLISIRKPKIEVVKPPKVFIGKIAIVLDDWGYSLNNTGIIEGIKYPLAVAVLPNLSYSKKISKDLSRRGFEVILHLPMEPKEKYALEKDTIKTSMDEGEIKKILAKDLDSLSNVKGVSNHMGSKATADIKTLGIVFKELKSRKLFFLDSYVTAQSKCAELALRYGLRYVKRDIFLDNNNDPKYIRKQLYKLKEKAKLNGYAVGIGHDRRNTLYVLKEVMPELEKEGYMFVFISELAR
ncbi:MAG: divergent polysaccharide deacetylase family protein [Candidatus Omnitrophica bacterium]|nr:divergent polysaccharide deacetylase family protein [Candidatus Omnitrophota bacterium]